MHSIIVYMYTNNICSVICQTMNEMLCIKLGTYILRINVIFPRNSFLHMYMDILAVGHNTEKTSRRHGNALLDPPGGQEPINFIAPEFVSCLACLGERRVPCVENGSHF